MNEAEQTLVENPSKEKPAFDNVFEWIRSFGWYQRAVFVGVNLVLLPLSVQFMLLVFGTGTPKFHCSDNSTVCPENKCCENCTSYVFDGPFKSAVSEWNLICDRAHIGATVQSCFFIGMLLGSIPGGWMSDTFGRRICLLGNLTLMFTFSIGTYFADCPSLLALLRMGVGFFLVPVMLCQYVFVMEFIGPKWRTFCGKFQDTFWDMGDLTNFALAFLIRDWRMLVLASTLMAIPFILSWRFVISLMNFGFFLFLTTLTGDIYVNFLVMGLLTLPNLPISYYLMRVFGRRITFVGYLLATSVLCLSVLIIPKDEKIALLIIALIGKSFISCSFNNVYLYTSELYPTVIRNLGISVGSTSARVGAILSPYLVMLSQLPGLSTTLPIIIFGVCGLLAGLLSLMLPETIASPMHQTIEESETYLDNYSPPCSLRKKEPPPQEDAHLTKL